VFLMWRRCWETVSLGVRVFGGSWWTIRKGSPAVCQSSVFCQKGVDIVGVEVVLGRLGGGFILLETLYRRIQVVLTLLNYPICPNHS
jgi:hypothetical protein